MMIYEICDREGDDEYFESHHLFPGKKRRKKAGHLQTIAVCTTCGDQIHNMFDNTTLRTELNSIEKLQEKMHTYISWIRKRELSDSISMKKLKK